MQVFKNIFPIIFKIIFLCKCQRGLIEKSGVDQLIKAIKMQRVLSLPQLARNTYNESSDYVSKRLCFSFLLAFAIIALGVGYLSGRVATLRQIELNAIICKAAKQRLYKSHMEAGKNLENHVKQESIAEYYR